MPTWGGERVSQPPPALPPPAHVPPSPSPSPLHPQEVVTGSGTGRGHWGPRGRCHPSQGLELKGAAWAARTLERSAWPSCREVCERHPGHGPSGEHSLPHVGRVHTSVWLAWLSPTGAHQRKAGATAQRGLPGFRCLRLAGEIQRLGSEAEVHSLPVGVAHSCGNNLP